MSRLQKKKPAGEKKKKKADAEKPVTADKTASAVRQVTTSGVQKTKPEKKSAGSAKDHAPGFIQNAVEFLREVKVELKKVTWPTRKQTTGTTIVVIIFVFVVAVFLGLFDYSLSKLVQVVLT
ncbi:MAG: preprotein translocase subunit SecE [Desulfotignum sp.]|nr:preprotein translocase subunit SecE [Desulfotignum sp.]MCF8113661.1 preprotein translocase subunit SecE [Desulfotignum sp.]MCF8125939.1 preprotein translocase subunit SecE [Desulfotignum sp.]